MDLACISAICKLLLGNFCQPQEKPARLSQVRYQSHQAVMAHSTHCQQNVTVRSLLSSLSAWTSGMPRAALPSSPVCCWLPVAGSGVSITWAALCCCCCCFCAAALVVLCLHILKCLFCRLSCWRWLPPAWVSFLLLLFLFVFPWKSLKSLESIAQHQLQIMQRHFYVLKLVSSLSLYFLRCTAYQFSFTIHNLLVKSLDKVLFRSRHWK